MKKRILAKYLWITNIKIEHHRNENLLRMNTSTRNSHNASVCLFSWLDDDLNSNQLPWIDWFVKPFANWNHSILFQTSLKWRSPTKDANFKLFLFPFLLNISCHCSIFIFKMNVRFSTICFSKQNFDITNVTNVK